MRFAFTLTIASIVLIILSLIYSNFKFQRDIHALTRDFTLMSAEFSFYLREKKLSHRHMQYHESLRKINKDIGQLRKNSLVVWKAENVNLAQDTLGGRVLEASGEFLNTPACFFPPIRHFLGHFCCPTCKILRYGALASGDCVAFRGTASFVIKLFTWAHIVGVSVEHIAEFQSPTGEITSAPQDFSLSAVAADGAEMHLENFAYSIQREKNLQTFQLNQPTQDAFERVKITFHTNHGNPDYTCLYRVKIHGVLSPKTIN